MGLFFIKNTFAGCAGGITFPGSTPLESKELAKGAPAPCVDPTEVVSCWEARELLLVVAGAIVVVAVLPGTVAGAWVPNGKPDDPIKKIVKYNYVLMMKG